MFDANGDGIPDHAQAMGNNVLGQLFGSKEVSNAVAAQAAATTGVGQAILKQMLPVIAAMVMGGLSKSASNRGLDGIFGQFAEMMSGKAAQPQAAGQPGQSARRHSRRVLRQCRPAAAAADQASPARAGRWAATLSAGCSVRSSPA